jgi:hypothetical protein
MDPAHRLHWAFVEAFVFVLPGHRLSTRLAGKILTENGLMVHDIDGPKRIMWHCYILPVPIRHRARKRIEMEVPRLEAKGVCAETGCSGHPVTRPRAKHLPIVVGLAEPQS